ncbi:MAG: hypothetical protein RBU45_20815 [Myxococcota bacterium]|jgi:hypothetical protein|nr:hypothetical protein [Myxococcota bacterium]
MDDGSWDFCCTVQRWRSQYAHLPLVCLPLLGVFLVVLLVTWAGPALPRALATILLNLAGLAFVALVVFFPRFWRRWQASGALQLMVGRGRFRLEEPRTGRILADGECRPPWLRLAAFSYSVTLRFAGGRYQAPALILRADSGAETTIGAPGAPVPAPAAEQLEQAPAYRLDAALYAAFLEAAGLPAGD